MTDPVTGARTDRVTVVTFPQPTVNGPLHVGHLSGPYLAADTAARAARARGERVVVTSGLDVHQNYVLTRAEREGLDVGAMTTEFRADIKETYRQARIGYDRFSDPLGDEHAPIVRALMNHLIASGATPLREVTLHGCADCGRTLHESYLVGLCATCEAPAAGGACEQCGSFTRVDTMVDPVCGRCGGPPRAFRATVPVLRMEEHRAALTDAWLRAQFPPAVRAVIGRQLAAGLPEIALAYPTNWGIEGDQALSGLRIGPYTEVALTDLYNIARAVDPAATDLPGYRAALGRIDNLWHFLGLDNAYWYAVYWQAVWAACGVFPLPISGLVVNQFYTLDGEKFSTSRNHAIWATELLRAQDPSIVRLFLAWDRPDRYQSDFTWNSFRAFAARVEPLLNGSHQVTEPLAPALAARELARGQAALRPAGFDPALAARCLITLLSGGADVGHLRTALTGLDDAVADAPRAVLAEAGAVLQAAAPSLGTVDGAGVDRPGPLLAGKGE
ncbi:Methionine--tRNA ligase [Kribbella flavida DSM 17836]|uniref:Methionine--tRNA ligase n=1 Tax=Kribbella flavida (strain DSM 17836 / JCM 10339 / NBRC 14399) TaxID=479435 RepID=D2Q1K9_KRIFD|nr:class I tRNA ligase family protein [Kribbella flavida]ADB31998.1 Methionine--tRNA ligase [Kribbella flavida DSM 17836]